jgi:probable HAF family extracellular repeat protein
MLPHVLTAAAFAWAAHTSAQPSLTALDFFPSAVSADGRVIVGTRGGGDFLGDPVPSDAIRWTREGGSVTILPPAFTFDGATAVSADGSIVVGSTEFGSFRWMAGAGMTLVDMGGPVDLSADGAVAAGTRGDPGEATRWTASDGVRGLGTLRGHAFSFANAVSADSSAVVGMSGSFGGEDWQAFRWTATAGMQGLGTLPGHRTSEANDASADARVVVGTSTFWSDDRQFVSGWRNSAFRWTSDGGMVDLGTLPGRPQLNMALGVSGDGSVVVGASGVPYFWGGDAVPDEAFIWDQAHGMRSLKEVLSGLGVDTTGWHLRQADGVSADGMTIIGTGYDPSLQFRGWVATVPEPAGVLSAVLAATAVVASGRARRTRNSSTQRRGRSNPSTGKDRGPSGHLWERKIYHEIPVPVGCGARCPARPLAGPRPARGAI